MIVLKFGGSSLADLDEIRRVIHIIRERQSHQPAVVVSAIGEITDVLQRLARQSLKRDDKFIIDELNNYFEPRLFRIIHGVVSDNIEQRKCLTEINRLLQELKNVYRGLTIIRELTPRALDTLLSYGELFSQIILFYALRAEGLPVTRPDARECIITDNHFGQAGILWEATDGRVRKNVLAAAEAQQIPIIQGFIGGTEQGTVTTLGRGGSDYTAAIIGAICRADEIQIWTDVDGFLTADPAVIPEARTIPELNINEAKELAQFGARVLHPKTVLPAIDRNIPVYIKNTFTPDKPGTLLSSREGMAGIHSITTMHGLAIMQLEWTHPGRVYGFDWKDHRFKEGILLSVRTPTCETLVIHKSLAEIIRSGLPDAIEISVQDDIGLIGLVGQELGLSAPYYRALLDKLNGVNFDMITNSPGNNRWLILVDDLQVDEILQKLYYTIFHREKEKAGL